MQTRVECFAGGGAENNNVCVVGGCVVRPRLGEEVDAVGDGVHGDGVPSDEEAPEVNSGQVMQLGVEAGQLPDVVADHVE